MHSFILSENINFRNMKWSSFCSNNGLTHASSTQIRASTSSSMQSTTTTIYGCQIHTSSCMEILKIHSFLFTLPFASTAMALSLISCGMYDLFIWYQNKLEIKILYPLIKPTCLCYEVYFVFESSWTWTFVFSTLNQGWK